MIHILHSQKDEILGWVSTVIEDDHKDTINNEESYDFQIFSDEDGANKINERSRFIIKGDDGEFREFIVDYIVDKTAEKKKEVFSVGSFTDLQKLKIIPPQTLEGQTVSTAGSVVLSETEWQVGLVDIYNVRQLIIEKHIGAYDALKLIASTFECELRFRIEVNGYEITGRYVDFLKRQGINRGKEITFGKDLVNITRKIYSEKLITALICLGPKKSDGTRLEVTVMDEEAYLNWNRKGQHLYGIYEPESSDVNMTLERLQTLGGTELKKRIAAAIEYEIDTVSLEHITGYEHEKVRKGDTVRIKDEKFNPPIYLEARVIDISEPPSNKSKKIYKIGEIVEVK